jgi:hypothetical protein
MPDCILTVGRSHGGNRGCQVEKYAFDTSQVETEGWVKVFMPVEVRLSGELQPRSEWVCA